MPHIWHVNSINAHDFKHRRQVYWLNSKYQIDGIKTNAKE